MPNSRVGNLPADLSSFVGRREEAHELRELFSHARLVTVVGPSGVGKSRLAVRVGSQLQRNFRDGAWLVELASVSGPEVVPDVVATALGVADRSGREPLDALRQHLADRQLLIVLDNCEQLRDACAALLAAALPHAAGVRVLATSQDVLGLPGEAVYRLDPLAVPEPDAGVEQVEVSPAVALFADRAANAMHGFSLTRDNVGAVVELCRRLDGLPLAIELAAAHARTLSPAQMLEHINDRFHLLASRSSAVPARHRSLKAAVEWSYDLCSKPERLVWNRLSVFPATFDLSAAQSVCVGEGLTGLEVAEAVGYLVDRSVLISSETRFGMRYRLLESIREFGVESLRASQGEEGAVPEEVLRARHLSWYAGVAGDFDRDWFGPRQHDWLERLHAELPNIRAALAFAVEHPGSVEEGLRLAGDLCFFWRVHALREGASLVTRILDVESDPSPGRGRALMALAWIKAIRGEPGRNEIAAEALATAERLDPERVPRALFVSATATAEGDLSSTTTFAEASLHAAEEKGSDADRAFAHYGIGRKLGLAGEVEEAEHHLQASQALSEAAGELWWRGAVQLRRALSAWLNGNSAVMEAAAADALRASRLVPDPMTCANALGVLGVAATGKDDRLAARLIGTAERFWDDAGGSILATAPWQAQLQDAKDRCREALGAAAYDDHARRGKDHTLEEAAVAALHEQPKAAKAHSTQHGLGLTRRELQVVALVSQGMTNKEIADVLVISTRTAEAHVQNILTKAGFTSRSQLAAWHARITADR